ncbi:portal protein [Maridesulfovibrio sp.]|uniref:portal protein n=1 Tax=Maridesulfovibrio sp. TaxID=2795000 RepID=UPI002A18BF3D|nr:portal protein [Maridesulfovibrio sp.]
MDLAENILSQYTDAKKDRDKWTGLWDELHSYYQPMKRSTIQQGQIGDEKIFESTPEYALNLLASGLGGLLTDGSDSWYKARHRDQSKADDTQVKEFLERVEEKLKHVFTGDDTGFAQHDHELLFEVCLLGTGAMYVEADPETLVRFSTLPLPQCVISESSKGRVDTLFREYEMSARAIMQEWKDKASDKVKEMAKKKPETKVAILHAVFPREGINKGIGAQNMPFGSVYMEKDSKTVLEESGYQEFPYMVPRWSKAAGEVFGRSPGMTALSDTRVLNAISKTELMGAEKMADRPMMVPDDSFLGPIRSGPGGISYYRAGTGDDVKHLPVDVDLAGTELMLERKEKSILRIFMYEIMASPEESGTATEWLIRQSEKLRLVKPVLTRLTSEYLVMLLKRVLGILHRSGELGPFPSGMTIDDIVLSVENAITRLRRAQESSGLPQVINSLAPFAQTPQERAEMMDNFDVDKIVRHQCDSNALPPSYLRDPDEVKARRNKRAEDMQAQQAVAGAGQLMNFAQQAQQLEDPNGGNAK